MSGSVPIKAVDHVEDIGSILLAAQNDLENVRRSLEYGERQGNPQAHAQLQRIVENTQTKLRIKAELVLNSVAEQKINSLPKLPAGRDTRSALHGVLHSARTHRSAIPLADPSSQSGAMNVRWGRRARGQRASVRGQMTASRHLAAIADPSTNPAAARHALGLDRLSRTQPLNVLNNNTARRPRRSRKNKRPVIGNVSALALNKQLQVKSSARVSRDVMRGGLYSQMQAYFRTPELNNNTDTGRLGGGRLLMSNKQPEATLVPHTPAPRPSASGPGPQHSAPQSAASVAKGLVLSHSHGVSRRVREDSYYEPELKPHDVDGGVCDMINRRLIPAHIDVGVAFQETRDAPASFTTQPVIVHAVDGVDRAELHDKRAIVTDKTSGGVNSVRYDPLPLPALRARVLGTDTSLITELPRGAQDFRSSSGWSNNNRSARSSGPRGVAPFSLTSKEVCLDDDMRVKVIEYEGKLAHDALMLVRDRKQLAQAEVRDTPRSYEELMDTYSLHNLIFRCGKCVEGTPEYASFRRSYEHMWNAVETVIKAVEAILRDYMPDQTMIVSGARMVALSRHQSSRSQLTVQEMLRHRATAEALVRCVLRQDDGTGPADLGEHKLAVDQLTETQVYLRRRIPQLAYLGPNGPVHAATKIQACVRMFLERRAYHRFLKERSACVRIQRLVRRWLRRVHTTERIALLFAERRAVWSQRNEAWFNDWQAEVLNRPHCVVHIPSFTWTQWQLVAGQEGKQARVPLNFNLRENQQIGRLVDAALNANVHVIYVSPFPLNQDIREYYVNMFQVMIDTRIKQDARLQSRLSQQAARKRAQAEFYTREHVNPQRAAVAENDADGLERAIEFLKIVNHGSSGLSLGNRIHIISAPKHIPMCSVAAETHPLSTCVYYSTPTLQRICELIGDMPAYLVPGQVNGANEFSNSPRIGTRAKCAAVWGHFDLKIAMWLGIPMLHAEAAQVRRLGWKFGSRLLFESAKVAIPVGSSNLLSAADLYRELARLIIYNIDVSRWMIKINNECEQRGLCYLDVHRIPFIAQLRQDRRNDGTRWKFAEIVQSALDQVGRCLQTRLPEYVTYVNAEGSSGGDWGVFAAALSCFGCVVEECIDGVVGSPTVCGLIRPDGHLEIVSAHDQIFAQPYRKLGSIFPTSAPTELVHPPAFRVLQRLKAEGVVGYVSMDFVVAYQREQRCLQAWGVDLNFGLSNEHCTFRWFDFCARGGYSGGRTAHSTDQFGGETGSNRSHMRVCPRYNVYIRDGELCSSGASSSMSQQLYAPSQVENLLAQPHNSFINQQSRDDVNAWWSSNNDRNPLIQHSQPSQQDQKRQLAGDSGENKTSVNELLEVYQNESTALTEIKHTQQPPHSLEKQQQQQQQSQQQQPHQPQPQVHSTDEEDFQPSTALHAGMLNSAVFDTSRIDTETGEFKLLRGVKKEVRYFVSLPFLFEPSLGTMPYPSFFKHCRKQDLSFDVRVCVGPVFTLIDSIACGCLGLWVAERSKVAVLQRTADTLAFLIDHICNADSGTMKHRIRFDEYATLRPAWLVMRKLLKATRALEARKKQIALSKQRLLEQK